MKNINEIDPIKYGFFHLAKLAGDVKAYAKTTGGLSPADDVDYYQTDNGVLICFKEQFHTSGYHDYQIIGDDGEYIMQMVPYEDMGDVFDKTTKHSFSFYNFWKSIEIPSSGTPPATWGGTGSLRDGQEFVRCDYNKFGPAPFYPRTTRYDVVGIKLVLSASGVGHILRVDTRDNDFKDKNTQIVNTYSRTFSGTLKQISEWSDMSLPPFSSSEDIAVKAKSFIDVLNLSNVINHINTLENDMRVSRYLSGNNDIYEEIEEANVFPDSLKSYFLKHMRYKTISSLLKNGLDSFSIDNSLLNKEKSFLEASIHSFCIANNIDLNLDLDEIQTIAKTNKSLLHPVDHIVDKINRYSFI